MNGAASPTLPTGQSEHDAPRFRGWDMVAVAFFVDFVAVGFFFYSYGVFFKAIAAEFGGSRLGVALGITTTTTVGAIAAPLIGAALDRFPLKRVIAVGTLCMAAGFLALSQVQTPLQFYLALGTFIGVGAASMGGLATAKLVANWFTRRRGMALGIAATGISASGVVMPFVSAAIIETWGWRHGFLLYGAFTLFVVLPIVLRLVISRPEDAGSLPDGPFRIGANAPTMPAVTAKGPGPWLRQRLLPATRPDFSPSTAPLLKERNFWVLASVMGLLFCCQSATLTHMVPRLTDAGVSLTQASLMMSVCAGLGMLGKLSFGWLADWWRARRAIWFTIVCQVAGQLLMFRDHDPLIFALGAGIFGFGMGGAVPLQGAVVGRFFGRERFGKALGSLRPAMFPLQIVGVPLAGWIFDTTGSYQPAFITFVVIYLVAALLATQFREHRLRPNRG
ncbi:MAG: MFS transporter [Pseudomonadales bacterium]